MFVAWNSSGIFVLTDSGDAKTSAHKPRPPPPRTITAVPLPICEKSWIHCWIIKFTDYIWATVLLFQIGRNWTALDNVGRLFLGQYFQC